MECNGGPTPFGHHLTGTDPLAARLVRNLRAGTPLSQLAFRVILQLNFGYFWMSLGEWVPFFSRFGLHCMSHVALELKTRTRARARWASLSFRSPLRPSDKVLSYDLLKCPNAAITRDYYKCIRRVQRIRMRHIRSGALEQKKRQTCQVKWIGKEGQGRQLGSLATGNKLFWPPTNKWNPKSHSTPAAPTPLRCQGFCLPSSWAPGHRFSWVPHLHQVALHAKES